MDELKLRELAEAATPGPWKSSGTKLQKGTRNICSHVNAGEQLPIGVDIERGISNAAFIAAANPAAILSLLDELQTLRSERTAGRVTAENAEAAQSLPDGWVMLDKNGVVHRYKWKRIDFFGSVDDSGTAFTLGEIEYETREWAGLAPFTVRPVSFMAPVARHWPMEEQPDGTVIPVDPSELIAASPAQPKD